VSCENPRHKKHVKDFIKKYPGADGKFGIITVNPEDWLVDLKHLEKNTTRCCQLCCELEDIKRVSSPDWKDQPDS
jgi:hypothetical protein